MTNQQVIKVCNKHKYILFRTRKNGGYELNAYNSKIVDLAIRKVGGINLNDESKFCGFIPCNFDTYISYKIPFYETEKV